MVFQESVYFRGCYRITDNAMQTMTDNWGTIAKVIRGPKNWFKLPILILKKSLKEEYKCSNNNVWHLTKYNNGWAKKQNDEVYWKDFISELLIQSNVCLNSYLVCTNASFQVLQGHTRWL